jgi:hypothetical protein
LLVSFASFMSNLNSQMKSARLYILLPTQMESYGSSV